MPSGASAAQWLKWERDLFLPLVAGAVVSIFAIFLILISDAMIPGFSMVPGYSVIIIATAIESIYVTRLARQKKWGFGQRVREVLALLLVARVAVAVSTQGLDGLFGIASIAGFKDKSFLLHAVALVFSWSLGNGFSDDIDHLTYVPQEELPAKGSDAYEKWFASIKTWLQSGRVGVIWFRYFALALVIVIALSTYQQVGRRGPDGGRLYPTLIWLGTGFYIVGLIALSYGYYLKLRIGWLAKGYSNVSSVARTWLGTGVAVVTLVITLALILPVNYSPWFGESTWITRFLAELFPYSKPGKDLEQVGKALTAFSEGIEKLARAQGKNAPVKRTFVSNIFDFLVNNAAAIKNGILVAGLAFLALYLIWPLLRGERNRRLSWQAVSGWADMAMKALVSGLKAVVGFIGALVGWLLSIVSGRRGWFLGRRREGDLGDLLGLSSLAQLKRAGLSKQALYILELYRKMMNLAGRRGYPYRKAQTANEYSSHLTANLPAINVWVDALTSLLVRVRYGRMELSKEETGVAESSWEEIRRHLEEEHREPGK